MLGDAGNIKLAVGKVVADVLAGVADAVVQRRIKRLVDGLHAAQQHLFKQVDRQQFGVAPARLPCFNNLCEQLTELRQMRLIRAI